MVETDTSNPPPTEIVSEIEQQFKDSARTYSSIAEPVNERENPDALFANGWGRRGHFALLVAPSGVGKSVISTQALVPWASGKPALIGSAPLFPLRVAVIQAEDDDTEMGEFRRDHRLGHQAEGYSLDEILAAEKKVMDWSPFFRGRTGDTFIEGVDLALRMSPADVIILNPLQSYTGFDIADNSELSAFLRTNIDGLLNRYRVFMLCVHHTNKPNTNRQAGPAWGEDATMAYCGAGGAELTNYARSVTIIRPCTPKESKLEHSYVLLGAKRGNRLGWKDADGKTTNRKIIAYSDGYIHWRVPTAEEIGVAKEPDEPGKNDGEAEQPSLTPAEAADMIAKAIRKEWPKRGVNGFCRDRLKLPRGLFAAAWDHFMANFGQYGMKIVHEGRGAYHFEPDPDAAQTPLPAEPDPSDPHDDDPEPYWQR